MRLLAVMFFFYIIIFGADDNETKKHIQNQMKKEHKYSVEQKFYGADEYDFKGAEVDEKSLENVSELPSYNEGFDMDDVYD